jgi:hypothetical protein
VAQLVAAFGRLPRAAYRPDRGGRGWGRGRDRAQWGRSGSGRVQRARVCPRRGQSAGQTRDGPRRGQPADRQRRRARHTARRDRPGLQRRKRARHTARRNRPGLQRRERARHAARRDRPGLQRRKRARHAARRDRPGRPRTVAGSGCGGPPWLCHRRSIDPHDGRLDDTHPLGLSPPGVISAKESSLRSPRDAQPISPSVMSRSATRLSRTSRTPCSPSRARP